MKKKSQLYKIKYICYTFIINRIIDTEFYSMKLCYNRTQKRVKCNSKEKKKKCPGNGRRGSSSRRTKVRRASSTRRKDSVRPLKTVVKEAQKIVEDERSLEQARRHRRITMIIVGTFIFLLVASVLVVVVTLTHSTFLSPPMGSKELAEHRAQT